MRVFFKEFYCLYFCSSLIVFGFSECTDRELLSKKWAGKKREGLKDGRNMRTSFMDDHDL